MKKEELLNILSSLIRLIGTPMAINVYIIC